MGVRRVYRVRERPLKRIELRVHAPRPQPIDDAVALCGERAAAFDRAELGEPDVGGSDPLLSAVDGDTLVKMQDATAPSGAPQ